MSEHNTVMQNFIKALQYYKEENWLLPVLNSLCIDLRILAGQVDAYSSPSDSSAHKTNSTIKPREALEKAADVMMTCFRICSSDNRSSEYETKRWGMLPIVNQLFKLYFRTNRLHLMKPLIRAIDSSPLKDKFDLSQQITYRYYVGRKAMFDSEYALANENLTFAFVRCHKACTRNKRMILIYLVPLRIFLGYLPTKTALEKYDLLQLWEVSQAVRHGDAKKLSEAIETHQEFFIKNGIYLILERLRIVTYRNLFKKVYLLEKQPVVPLQDLLAALRLVDREDTTLEEANCILANLIHQGKIKGYISHSHQKVHGYHFRKHKDKKYFGVYEYHRPTLVLNDLDLVEHVLVKDFSSFANHPRWVIDESSYLNQMTLNLRGNLWRATRHVEYQFLEHFPKLAAWSGMSLFSKKIDKTMRETSRALLSGCGATSEFRSLIEGIKSDGVLRMKGKDFDINGNEEADHVFESMRIHSVKPFLFREATRDYTFPGTDLKIKTGEKVVIPAISFQMDPQHYPEPEKFKPERWSEDARPKSKFTWLPFGEGPRQCLGMRFSIMEMKLVLGKLLTEFEMTISPRTAMPAGHVTLGIVGRLDRPVYDQGVPKHNTKGLFQERECGLEVNKFFRRRSSHDTLGLFDESWAVLDE
ncbi:unnamed protein product [Nesidiocoris tenuis]|uniref:CSN12-like protein n=1 Tax=Nesidiocoris tenuis TaxID=355587 RepID=A0A6H5GJ21_9HEMI|nr:unnamed protein product [Nesidiocoris tenuis]